MAATAIEHGLTLATPNIWTFKGIVGLDASAAACDEACP
jgi:predicted nucleic acid-binding protein